MYHLIDMRTYSKIDRASRTREKAWKPNREHTPAKCLPRKSAFLADIKVLGVVRVRHQVIRDEGRKMSVRGGKISEPVPGGGREWKVESEKLERKKKQSI